MKTEDRSGDVLVVDQIGRTRYLTPAGYLFCEGVRISSIKPRLYRPDEIPEIEPASGMVLMQCDPEVLFSEETIASYQGMDVTQMHPGELLTPETWRQSTVGTVLNPRRGEGADADYLLADLLIKDQDAIDLVLSGRPEVSCGYDSDREQVKPGVGRFTRIIGNHTALVDKGRAGPDCAIQDKDTIMAKRTVWDRLKTAFAAKDEAAFNEELEAAKSEGTGEEPKGGVVVHVHNAPAAAAVDPDGVDIKDDDEGAGTAPDPIKALTEAVAAIAARLDKIEAGLSKDTAAGANEGKTDDDDGNTNSGAGVNGSSGSGADSGPGVAGINDGDEKDDKKDEKDAKTMDRAAFQSVVSQAEILCPGVKLPTLDTKASGKVIADAADALRKTALEGAFKSPERKIFVTKVAGARPNLGKMTGDALAIAFSGAAELAREANNRVGERQSFDHKNFPQGPMTAAKLQEINAASRAGK